MGEHEAEDTLINPLEELCLFETEEARALIQGVERTSKDLIQFDTTGKVLADNWKAIREYFIMIAKAATAKNDSPTAEKAYNIALYPRGFVEDMCRFHWQAKRYALNGKDFEAAFYHANAEGVYESMVYAHDKATPAVAVGSVPNQE